MTTIAQVRSAALALPEVEEGTHFGMVAFTVRKQGFASLTKEGVLQLRLPEDEAESLVSQESAAQLLQRFGKTIGATVPLADINGQALNHWVRRAWFARAPKRLADTLAEAENARPGTVGDLPKSIGAPATRALAGAGITTLDAVAERTEEELLALHGVGPRAVRILSQALAERERPHRR